MYFFFFQAEDGIRDIGVTGVQTCALPISDQDQNGAIARKGSVPSAIRTVPKNAGRRRPLRSESRPPSGEKKTIGSESPAKRRPTCSSSQLPHPIRNTGRDSSRVYMVRLLNKIGRAHV